jgi:hypothetical protein
MRTTICLVATLAAFAVPAVAAADAGAGKARGCGNVGRPATDYGAFGIRATHTSCARARRIARAVLRTRSSPFGYRCRGVWHGGRAQPLPHAHWKCTKRKARVTWSGSPKPKNAS